MMWGYVLGKACGRLRKTDPNIALLIVAGGIIDFDIFTGRPYNTLFGHHGIAHSWLVITLIFVPLFFRFGWQCLPYFVAVIQHPLFGDLITNRIPLLFPLTLSETGMNLSIYNPMVGIALEFLGYVLFLVIFTASNDWKKRVAATRWNLFWLSLWIPPIALTIAQAFGYYEPVMTDLIYTAYALVSSFTLFAAGGSLALRSFRKR